MKIAVVFFVVVVSSCSGSHHDGVPHHSTTTCLIDAQKRSDELLVKTSILVCTYQRGLGRLNEESWRKVYGKLQDALGETGCEVDAILNIPGLSGYGEPSKAAVSELVDTIRPILESDGLANPAFNAVSALTKQLLTTDCFSLIVEGQLTQLLIDLKAIVCKRSSSKIESDDLRSIVERSSCLLVGGPLKDPELTNVVDNIIQDSNGVLIFHGPALQIGNIITQIFCTVVKALGVLLKS